MSKFKGKEMKAKTKLIIVITSDAKGVAIDIETYAKEVKLLTILGALDLARANFIESHFTNPQIKPKQGGTTS